MSKLQAPKGVDPVILAALAAMGFQVFEIPLPKEPNEESTRERDLRTGKPPLWENMTPADKFAWYEHKLDVARPVLAAINEQHAGAALCDSPKCDSCGLVRLSRQFFA